MCVLVEGFEFIVDVHPSGICHTLNNSFRLKLIISPLRSCVFMIMNTFHNARICPSYTVYQMKALINQNIDLQMDLLIFDHRSNGNLTNDV